MEPGEILKREAFDNLITIFIPGALAIFPYIFILSIHYPVIIEFWKIHNVVYVSIYIFFSILAGLLIDGFGLRIEKIWDFIIDSESNPHNKEWEVYLKLNLKDEIIAQRYLSVKLVGMKVELALSVSVFFVIIGIVWLFIISHFCSGRTFAGILLSLIILFMYILWESYSSARLLGETRKLILDAMSKEY